MAIHALRHRHEARTGHRPTLEAVPRTERRPDVDRDYWIAHCEGYRVEGRDGRIGIVEATRPDPLNPGGTVLVIRRGVFGRQQVLAGSNDVAMIVPRAERIWLSSDAPLIPAA